MKVHGVGVKPRTLDELMQQNFEESKTYLKQGRAGMFVLPKEEFKQSLLS